MEIGARQYFGADGVLMYEKVLVIGDVEPRDPVPTGRMMIAPEWGDRLAEAHVVGDTRR